MRADTLKRWNKKKNINNNNNDKYGSRGIFYIDKCHKVSEGDLE